MRCPNCSSEVSSSRSCPNCGAPLTRLPGTAMLPAGVDARESIPLTFGQKARLLLECLPVPFFVLALLFVLTILKNITRAAPPLLLPLLLGLVIVMVGWAATQRLRDFALGVALVREDLLERAYRSRGGQGSNRFRGVFEQLGSLRLTPNAYHQVSGANQRYRIAYSPASRIVWSLERLD